ncbi:MAG: hypothetical protein HQ559_03615, partial [Lentisphaerae bacterium]|nr:hypothetical protein [Lentisphaerota bacterium]
KDDIRYVQMATTVGAGGKPDGKEVEFRDWYRHPIRTTEYRDGVRHGVELQYDEKGIVLRETPWNKGTIEGVKRVFHPNGKVATESTYEKGEIKGKSRSFSPEGALLRVTPFAGGKRNGDCIDYWPEKPDVVKRIITYRKGQVHGGAKSFYLNGKIKWERIFENNRQHGVERHYAADGKVEKTIYWIEGDQVSEEAYRKGSK